MQARRAGLALLAATSVTRASVAGNLDTYYMSSEAALQAGAISADARGGGALWYNPAGLATMAGLRLDVSVNALRLSIGGEADLETNDKNARIERLPMRNLTSVPAAVTLTRKFGDFGLGFGMFVPMDEAAILRSQFTGRSTSGDGDVELGVDAHSTLAEYFVGPGLGWRVGPALSLGASLFLNYRSELDSAAVEGSVVPDQGDQGAVLLHETIDWQQVGMQGVCGLQLHPDRKWAAGLTLRLPVVRLHQVRQSVQMQLLSLEGTTETQNDFAEKKGFDAHVIAPPRVHVGLSRSLADWHVALEANYQFPFSDEEQPRRLLAVANLRAGLRHQVSSTLRIGGGLYSDRSPYEAKAFTDRALNYYGVTLGGELSTPYITVQKGDQAFAAPRPLVFATGLALSYAVGVGRVVRADVVSAVPTELELKEVPVRMVAHEFTLHIAATLGE